MSDLFSLTETPTANEVYMIAGWRQWADAGSASSGLPEYLVRQTDAQPIGHLPDHGYYLFQVPGTHHFLRPEIKLKDGYRQELERYRNELYFAGDERKGVVIFLGDEPHLNIERYADAFFAAVRALKVSRIVVVGGVFGAMPYDRDRFVACVYSLPAMREELEAYAVSFSNYEGGASVGTYMADRAEREGVELVGLYVFVPAYDFSGSEDLPQGVRIENDYKGWFDLMKRVDYMFRLGMDLSDLRRKSERLVRIMDDKMADLERAMPQLDVRTYLETVNESFTELPFEPLDDMWEQELRDILDDLDAEE